MSIGYVALVQGEFLLEPGRMSLEFSLTLGFCKRVIAWIRVIVISSKSQVFACTEEQHYSLRLGNNDDLDVARIYEHNNSFQMKQC